MEGEHLAIRVSDVADLGRVFEVLPDFGMWQVDPMSYHETC
ncbi:hypothetical protein RE6C_01429 [Rhodopirellula europaea 6C]|uniref:Uncharacterized protein n=1 Tax=Rhodopirellula europaea 6C TaxID=1263867 RepID=M2B7U3_9BACT|nr:hypothetical protein RE6C_01429 [Rhodopirellula europaea 6C]